MGLETTLSVEIRMTSSQDLVHLTLLDLHQDVDPRVASWAVEIGPMGTCNRQTNSATVMETNGGVMEAVVGMVVGPEEDMNAEETIMAVVAVEDTVAVGMVVVVVVVVVDMEAAEAEAEAEVDVGAGVERGDLGNKTASVPLV